MRNSSRSIPLRSAGLSFLHILTEKLSDALIDEEGHERIDARLDEIEEYDKGQKSGHVRRRRPLKEQRDKDIIEGNHGSRHCDAPKNETCDRPLFGAEELIEISRNKHERGGRDKVHDNADPTVLRGNGKSL